MKHVLAVLAILVLAAPAVAQSKRYPAEPIDKDREKAEKSKLWDAATNPAQEPYRKLIAEGRQAIEQRTPDMLRLAITTLDQAITLMPRAPEAYRLRGDAHFALGEWAACADDLRSATLQTGPNELLDKKAASDTQLRLGNCLARAGKLAEAERTLAEASAGGTNSGEMLMRLGEVRIALGKLDEAIGALQAAIEVPDTQQAQTRLLLASAYDRARRPAEAIEQVQAAARYDRTFTSIDNPQLPFINPGERAYLLALAYASQESSKAEYALVYYRAFLKAAPDSPWHKRAEEHLRDLKMTVLPESVERVNGGAALDLDATAAIVRKAMPAMRACMAKVPLSVMELKITRSGPASPRVAPIPGRYQPRKPTPPPDGVYIEARENTDSSSRGDRDAAARCIEPLATKLPLPPIKEKDAFYQIKFNVVGL